ncbi:hypothetical protein JL720_1108 [Aureococcus anophagefferens]|nr:hypothetical protein JL720_1108 [Aureococcus anophagefferens]
MARSSKIQRLLGPDWSIKFMKADGDCYYAAISAALENDFTVQALRDVVADACTEETLTMMRLAQRTGCGSYDHLRKIDDTVAEHLGLAVLILDEAAPWGSQYVSILPDAPPDRVVCLQRTRRQHYNLLVRGETTFFDAADEDLGARWPAFGRRYGSGGGGDAPAAAEDAPAAKRRRR